MNVKIRNAEYVGSVYEDLPELPEVAFAGRSNVGKSSLINALLNRRSLVRTSKQPGKTRNVNYFQIDMVDLPSIYMVDLPGYGYAKVPQGMKDEWGKLAARYFHNNKNLKLLLVLVDIRRDVREEEFMALDLVKETEAKALVIATKADKLKRSQYQKNIARIKKQCGITPLLCSSLDKAGLEQIWDEIVAATATAESENE